MTGRRTALNLSSLFIIPPKASVTGLVWLFINIASRNRSEITIMDSHLEVSEDVRQAIT